MRKQTHYTSSWMYVFQIGAIRAGQWLISSDQLCRPWAHWDLDCVCHFLWNVCGPVFPWSNKMYWGLNSKMYGSWCKRYCLSTKGDSWLNQRMSHLKHVQLRNKQHQAPLVARASQQSKRAQCIAHHYNITCRSQIKMMWSDIISIDAHVQNNSFHMQNRCLNTAN